MVHASWFLCSDTFCLGHTRVQPASAFVSAADSLESFWPGMCRHKPRSGRTFPLPQLFASVRPLDAYAPPPLATNSSPWMLLILQNKKRDFRRLWIERINAGVRQHGMSYSVFVSKANKADVELNRKVRRACCCRCFFCWCCCCSRIQQSRTPRIAVHLRANGRPRYVKD